MSAPLCTCGSLGRSDLRQCAEHHHIWRGDLRLASVSSIVAASFPLDATIPHHVLENARERGSEVDALFGKYVLGGLDRIPAGTRTDSRDLFLKAKSWFDGQNFKKIESQVVLGCEDFGGVVDVRFDGTVADLKCTYNIEQSAKMQVAAYSALADSNGYILHVTARFAEARLIRLLDEDLLDWNILLEHWRMVKRRTTREKKS